MICMSSRPFPYSSSTRVISLPMSPSTIASLYDTSSAIGPSSIIDGSVRSGSSSDGSDGNLISIEMVGSSR